MIKVSDYASALKTLRPAGGAVKFIELFQNIDDIGFKAHLTINEQPFMAYVEARSLRHPDHDHDATMKAIRAPLMAPDKIWSDGIEEGRRVEREDKIRLLMTENAELRDQLRERGAGQ